MDITRSGARTESHGWRKQREKHYGVAVISMQQWPGLISNQYADLSARGRGGPRFFLRSFRDKGGEERSFCKLIQCVLVLMFVL